LAKSGIDRDILCGGSIAFSHIFESFIFDETKQTLLPMADFFIDGT